MSVPANGGAGAFIEIPTYVRDVSLRIYEGDGTTEGYFNFGLLTESFSDYGIVHYPWGGVADPSASPGRVLVVRRNGSTRLGVFDTLTEALAALSQTCALPDYTPGAADDAHAWALLFFERCVELGVACPRSQPDATRRERQNIREALARERAHFNT